MSTRPRAADVLGPLVTDAAGSHLAGLVSEEGRLDPTVVASLTAALVEAVRRMSTIGATGAGAKAEIVALRDLASCVDAAKQVAIAAYAARYAHEWDGHEGPVTAHDAGVVAERFDGEFCEADLAPSLRMGKNAAAHRITAALAMTTVLSATLEALTTGAIDEPRARTIATELADATDRVALAVEALVLPGAGRVSTRALRERVRAARAQVDPGHLRDETKDGPSRRFVRFEPSPTPGMTDLFAHLPAEDAAALQAAINKMARRYRIESGDDDGGEDQRTLTQRRADAFLALALSDVEIEVALDITVPSTSMPADVTAPEPTVAGPGGPGTDVGRDVDLGEGTPPPASCGGLIPGIGIVPTERLAHLLHDPDVLIRRFLLDPRTGVPLPLVPTTYRPGAALAAVIRLRDGTCRFPFCDRPAALCDLDHITPFPHGPTVPENLLTLCRHHHRLKHHTRWKPDLDPHTGHVTWTDPQDHTWTTAPAELLAPHPQPDG